jgi:hypothetical protein
MSVAQGAGTYPAYIGNGRLLSAADGGTALSTTRAFIAIPAGINSVIITPRNFATAVVAQVALNPFIAVIKTNDAMATAPTDYSENAQDGAAGTLVTLSSLPTLANGGALYVGAADTFGGLMATVVAGDGGAGDLDVDYWDGDSWADITPTDGTANMANTGLITWTVPTDWAKTSLVTALNRIWAPLGQNLYWVRLSTTVAYDASVTLSSLYAYNKYADALPELASGQVFQTAINRPQNGGNIQALTDAGTANLIVNGYA